MKKPNHKISRRYSEYRLLLEKPKILRTKVIVITATQNRSRQDYLENRVPLEHPELSELILLRPKVKDKEARKFHFGIHMDSFCSQPCFRFDSDGPAHKNDLEGVPLAQRQITTPHFHKFLENGIEIAYKTPQLMAEDEVQVLLDDVNLGLAHFCHEANIRLPNGNFPEIARESENLLKDEGYHDPLSGIIFN